jgi:WD40 repeat protein
MTDHYLSALSHQTVNFWPLDLSEDSARSGVFRNVKLFILYEVKNNYALPEARAPLSLPIRLIFFADMKRLGHTDKIGGIKWHPRAHIDQARGAVNLATGGGDGIVNLWSLERYDILLVSCDTSLLFLHTSVWYTDFVV